MKSIAVVVAILLVLAHPGAAAAVVGAELAACAVLCVVILRALQPLCVNPGRHRRAA